jgi:hypothetical protein
MAEKDASAVDLGQKRWRGKTKAQKRAHSLMMNDKRWAEHRKKKAKKKKKEAEDA